MNSVTLQKAIALVCLLAGMMAAPAAYAQHIDVKHAQGTTSVPLKPKTVIVFDLAALDTLDLLGVKAAGIPGGVPLPAYLAKAATGPEKVGTLFEPDYEAVNALQPDLIIIAGRSAPKYAALSKIAPTIDLTVDGARYLASAQDNVRTLGRIFDKEKEATAALAKLDTSIAALKAKAARQGKALLILTTGGKMSTYGAGSRFGLAFSDFGVAQADEDIKVGVHGQPTSFEYILQKNPDWLFVIDRDQAIGREGDADGSAARKLLDNEIVGRTTAWQKKQVVYLDAGSWYLVGGGLTSLQNSVDQLDRAFSK
ncbi:iron ABC transporter substrate-binding protein [Azorhizobium oxalatiphilum]|uniref:Iron ABC transporter substrate-binding protein n=1 Tax=Azorhizobium oxalatiphilum TaxID=980631 RepID=A0A917BU76_9HYPH|nr:siderophore ABC transporter substrate-binding protein [Azorhizobium oxalatiphilum]GGF54609.1 iron ABC transporter substrate-binding protein [Azorhizobium oxalatiphilum]